LLIAHLMPIIMPPTSAWHASASGELIDAFVAIVLDQRQSRYRLLDAIG